MFTRATRSRLVLISLPAATTAMYIPPPQSANGRKSYTDAYKDIISAYRRSPQTSASSVILLVAPDVDSLCAARMLASLFKQDDVLYRLIPVSSVHEMQIVKDELATYAEVGAGLGWLGINRALTTPRS